MIEELKITVLLGVETATRLKIDLISNEKFHSVPDATGGSLATFSAHLRWKKLPKRAAITSVQNPYRSLGACSLSKMIFDMLALPDFGIQPLGCFFRLIFWIFSKLTTYQNTRIFIFTQTILKHRCACMARALKSNERTILSMFRIEAGVSGPCEVTN